MSTPFKPDAPSPPPVGHSGEHHPLAPWWLSFFRRARELAALARERRAALSAPVEPDEERTVA